jgi:acyl phosphate:glycerol-3-phosphate acyltransferase
VSAALLAWTAAYLLGGIPFGLIVYRLVKGGDIRAVGSGNIGATNVGRSAGWLVGLATLALDASKGAAAVALARALVPGDPACAAAAALLAVAGHCFSIFLGFRGGKGVATGCGAFTLLHPAAMAAALAVFLLTLALTRMVSAGSIAAAVAFPIASGILGAGAAATACAGFAGLVIVARHHDNIVRIVNGSERRLGERKR